MGRTKDIAMRALKTFIQGFLGALAVTLPNTDLNDCALKSVLIGAIAGGISAVMNLVIQKLEKETYEEI